MRPPEIIHTERLTLRPPSPNDAEAIFQAYAQDAEVTRYLMWRPLQEVREAELFLSKCIAAWETANRFPWVITLKSSGELIGMIEIRVDEFKAHVGYVIARPFWGKGLATEALRPVVGWALEQESIYRVWALCDIDNIGSARVLEKVGMQREGVLRRNILHPSISHEPRDSYCYA